MTWPINDRVRAREDGNVSAAQIAILTGLETQSVVGHLSRLKEYGLPNAERLGFTWESDRYSQLYLTSERAVLYTREVLLPLVRRRGGRVETIEGFLASADPLIDDARERKLRQLHQNAETMAARFLVITPGHNAEFLRRLNAEHIDAEIVDAVLRAQNIRPVSLDNPARWTPEGYTVQPKKFQGLHPHDVTDALDALQRSIDAHLCPFSEDERAERATLVWLPRQANKWQHVDPTRSTYPPGIRKVALRHDQPHKGWAKIRVFLEDDWEHIAGETFSVDETTPWPPLNGCVLDLSENEKKSRFEGVLTPDDVEEILL